MNHVVNKTRFVLPAIVAALLGLLASSLPAQNAGSYPGRWDNQFGVPGVVSDNIASHRVYSIALDSEYAYLGGDFLYAGNIRAKNLVRWNRQSGQWSTLGDVDGTIAAMTIWNGNLVIAGDLRSVAGKAIGNVARWDGKGWHPLGDSGGSSLGGASAYVVNALASTPSALYVAGSFRSAGGDTTIRNIARWSGGTWSGLGEASVSPILIRTMVVGDSGRLYVGGDFERIGDTAAVNVAMFDGSRWHPLGEGIGGNNGYVTSLAFVDSTLYAGGEIGWGDPDAPIRGVGRWDGSRWQSTGRRSNHLVTALATLGDTLIAADLSTVTADTDTLWNLTAYDWVTWKPLLRRAFESAGNPEIYALAADGSDLLAGGTFHSLSTARAINVGLRRNGFWRPLHETPSGGLHAIDVYAIAAQGPILYLGGRSLGGTIPVGLAVVRWDTRDNTWEAIGTSVLGKSSSIVFALAIDGDNLYAGGHFPAIGGIDANSIARYSISRKQWSAMGAGVRTYSGVATVWSVTVDARGSVYIGGQFPYTGGAPNTEGTRLNSIAAWDAPSETWKPMSYGGKTGVLKTSGADPNVRSLATSGDDLFVGGEFDMAGSVTASNIARWNSRERRWYPVLDPADMSETKGADGIVLDLEVVGNELFAAGGFRRIGSVWAPGLGRWSIDSSRWSGLGTDSAERMIAIVPYRDGLIASSRSGLMRWQRNGGVWSRFTDSLNAVPTELAIAGNDLIAAGSFTMAGDTVSYSLARRIGSVTSAPIREPGGELSILSITSAPARTSITIRFSTRRPATTTVRIVDPLGRLVAVPLDTYLQAEDHLLTLNVAELAAGWYICHIQSGNRSVSAPLFISGR